MLKRLLPKTTSFFDFFERHTKLSKEACAELDALAANPGEMKSRVEQIKEIEHQADNITRSCIEALHNTFITPIDRSDIQRLMRRLDDIIDTVDSIAARMSMYGVTQVRPETRQLTQILIESVEGIDKAIRELRHLNKKGADIQRHCYEVYDAETRADAVLRSAIVHLLEEERDPIRVITWKEIFERLERATDRCQEAADIISGIVIEAS